MCVGKNKHIPKVIICDLNSQLYVEVLILTFHNSNRNSLKHKHKDKYFKIDKAVYMTNFLSTVCLKMAL
jgi:hypothetical protein